MPWRARCSVSQRPYPLRRRRRVNILHPAEELVHWVLSYHWPGGRRPLGRRRANVRRGGWDLAVAGQVDAPPASAAAAPPLLQPLSRLRDERAEASFAVLSRGCQLVLAPAKGYKSSCCYGSTLVLKGFLPRKKITFHRLNRLTHSYSWAQKS